jgi:hypothetical protein
MIEAQKKPDGVNKKHHPITPIIVHAEHNKKDQIILLEPLSCQKGSKSDNERIVPYRIMNYRTI